MTVTYCLDRSLLSLFVHIKMLVEQRKYMFADYHVNAQQWQITASELNKHDFIQPPKDPL